MSKDYCCNDNNCCNPCNNSVNDDFSSSYLWILVLILIFKGFSLKNDCFWDGYCNAFNSSAFSCKNFSNNSLGNSTNNNFSNFLGSN